MKIQRFTVLAAAVLAMCLARAEENLFSHDNLVAWCIVPFDAKKRGPEERAVMLEKLGFKHFAYDWRAEHIPTFDAEIDALQKHKVELTAWWFPNSMSYDAETILSVLKKRGIKTQLWVSCGGGNPQSIAGHEAVAAEANRLKSESEATRLKPIVDAATAIGCTVELYNHGGWLGEPEQLVALADELKKLNAPVGIVYNLHHGHDQIDHLSRALKKMMPYLHAINITGMAKDGMDAKVLPVGQGDLDLSVLKTIRDSGYKGRIGLINHTDEDAETRLKASLDGLDKLAAELEKK